jgi:hypothetical protein
MPSVARNAQEAQMRQALQLAMQPKPAGIEGLPSNIRMAEGGVVGYAGPDGSFVGGPRRVDVSGDIPIYAPREDKEPGESEAEYRARKAREAEEAQGERPIPRGLRWIQENILRPMSQAGGQRMAEMRGTPETPPARPAPIPAPQVDFQDSRYRTTELRKGEEGVLEKIGPAPLNKKPEIQFLTSSPAPRPPAQRPPAPAQTAPQGGIAELVAPTPESAMASARSVLGMPGTEGLRKREEAYLAALKAQPATGQQGLAALQAQQAALQAMNEKAEKESNINSAIQWLLGGREGPGGSARSSIAFSEREDARRRSYNDLQVANATKRDAIIDLQNAREVGNAKAALEAEQRIRAAEVDVAKAEATLAGQFASSQANVYGTQMQAETAAANRASNERIARIQAAARDNPGGREAMAVARVQQAINSSPMLKSLAEKAKFDPTAAAQYAAEEARLYQQLAPELLQNRPAPAPSAALKYNPATGKIE